MENAWKETLDGGHVLLIDGGMGPELQRRGVPMDKVAWSGAGVRGGIIPPVRRRGVPFRRKKDTYRGMRRYRCGCRPAKRLGGPDESARVIAPRLLPLRRDKALEEIRNRHR